MGLIKSGFDKTAIDKFGNTPLQVAEELNLDKVAKILVETEADKDDAILNVIKEILNKSKTDAAKKYQLQEHEDEKKKIQNYIEENLRKEIMGKVETMLEQYYEK